MPILEQTLSTIEGKENLAKAVQEISGFLQECWDQKKNTESALEQVNEIQKNYPALEIDLVWERLSTRPELHYVAVVGAPGYGAVSLSFCPELPSMVWMMRTATKKGEEVIAQINDREVDVASLLACLDGIWNTEDGIQSIIDQSIIASFVNKQRELLVTNEEIQAELDQFRVEYGLFQTEAMEEWMHQRGISLRNLEVRMRGKVKIRKFSDQLVAGREMELFEKHQDQLQSVKLCSAWFQDEATARAVHSDEFMQQAVEEFVRHDVAPPRGAIYRRRNLAPDLAQALFSAQPGEVIGPFKEGNSWRIFQLLKVIEPVMKDSQTIQELRDIALQTWLEKQRQEAKIQWYWGDLEHHKNAM